MKKNSKLKTAKKTKKPQENKKIPEEFLIRSPEKEYESFVEKEIEQAIRFGEEEKVELYRKTLDQGCKVLSILRNKRKN